MKQRQVQDKGNTIWDCVEAFSAISNGNMQKTAALSPDKGMVDVVCTPSGGAQSVRLRVAEDWLEKMTEEKLLAAIEEQRR